MDRNTIAGILLITAILIGYSVLNKPSQEELEEAKRKRDSIEYVRKIEQEEAIKAKIDSARQAEQQQEKTPVTSAEKNIEAEQKMAAENKYGIFAESAKGSDTHIILENEKIKLFIAQRGGKIATVELKEYKTYDGNPLILFEKDSSVFGFNFFAQNKRIATNDLYFTPTTDQTHFIAKQTDKTVKLRLYASEKEESYIEYEYHLAPNEYMLDYKVNFVNMDRIIPDNLRTLSMTWETYANRLEKGAKNENMYTSIYYKHHNDEVDNLRSRSSSGQEEEIPTQVKWIAFKHQFFSSVIMAEDAFANAFVEFQHFDDHPRYLKKFMSEMAMPFESGPETSMPFSFYFGPNHFSTLKEYGHDFESLVTMGVWIIKWINRYLIIPVFNFLDNFINSYGIIILLLTFIIKTLLFPLTFKSFQSQAKMRVLKPQVDEINKKFPSKDKAMEKQQATMALYKKAGASPMGGCLPMLLQMPILIAMYRFFPASIELRQESFLWAADLSTYDSILNLPFEIPMYGSHVSLFTLLMTASTILTTKINSQAGASSSSMPGMKSMMYVMPVMLLVILNSFSAGLTYYLFLANIITFGQNMIFKLFVDEDELLKKMNEKKKKPKKKSGFQAKLEEMQKQQKGKKSGKK